MKKWSLFNVQLPFVIDGCASRDLFSLRSRAEGASENDKWQLNIAQRLFLLPSRSPSAC
jgi:hypothetical protein